MRSRRWPRVAVVVSAVAAVVWAVGMFGLPSWLLTDQHLIRNVLEGLSWPAGIVAALAPFTPGLLRWLSGRSITPLTVTAEDSAKPLVGRALHLVDGELPPVREVGLLELRVKPAIDTHAEDGSDLPPYVARDIDVDLEWAIYAGGLVLLHGPAAVGKSRAAAEALRRLRPDHKLLVPDDGPALREIVDAKVDLSDTVLWLDDLERYLGDQGLDVGLAQRLCSPTNTGVAIVATMRDEQLALHANAGTGAIAGTGAVIDRAAVEVLAGIRGQRRIRVAAALTDTERARAALVAERDARVRRAVMAPEGFAEYLAAGAAMMDRWSTGETPEFIRGQALVSAAVDCRRAGHHDPVTAALLADLHIQFLPPAWRNRADLPSLDAGLRWATRRVLGASSCLQPAPDRRYLASDYLLDRTRPGRTASASPLTGPVSDTTWTILVAALTSRQTLRIGVTAYLAGRHDVAEQIFASAGTHSPEALFTLGVLLGEQPGREAEAELVLRAAGTAGNVRALNNLGILLGRQPGREAEAERAYRAAIAAGNIKALKNLGNLLGRQPGRAVEAERAYRHAVAAGSTNALVNLGNLLSGQAGREADAEGAYRAGIAAGDTEALFNLGVLLSGQPGREADAEWAYREAVAAGNAEALFNLGVLLSGQAGREADAEGAYRAGIAAGDTEALFNLGVLLSGQPGREADAEWAYREAVAAGNAEALFNLGVLLSGQAGREADAEWAYREAVAAGKTKALNNLGILLSGQPGREADAEWAYREAVAAGKTKALNNLGILLSGQPGREADAERAYRDAVATGNAKALVNLWNLLGKWPGGEFER